MTTSPAVMMIAVPSAAPLVAEASTVADGPVDGASIEGAAIDGSDAGVSSVAGAEHAVKAIAAMETRAIRGKGFFMES
ncbi:hypothetical protein [Arthrobacter sp. N1]|uniref:hypothetical protein n=1 Tax=Arthrobacter sp. N1 TaxID=619291 RepID=UPI003BAF39E1